MNDAAEMTKAFEYVSDVYRTCATMLLSADAPLADRGFAPYDWYAIWPDRGRLCINHAEWLPTFVLRQYHRPAHVDREVMTVAAVLWGRKPRPAQQSLAIASHMMVETTDTNDVFRWAIVQRWCKTAPPDGVIRQLVEEDIQFEGNERATFASHVTGAKVLSVAVPLPSISKTDELMSKLADPLIAKVLAAEGTVAHS